MSCYISSNNERIYCALESSYGVIPGIVGADRIPALKFKARQVPEQTSRKDKTGSRTFVGMPNGIRETTTFDAWSRAVGREDVRHSSVPEMRCGNHPRKISARVEVSEIERARLH